jgi:hypothetical protein
MYVYTLAELIVSIHAWTRQNACRPTRKVAQMQIRIIHMYVNTFVSTSSYVRVRARACVHSTRTHMDMPYAYTSKTIIDAYAYLCTCLRARMHILALTYAKFRNRGSGATCVLQTGSRHLQYLAPNHILARYVVALYVVVRLMSVDDAPRAFLRNSSRACF